MHPLIELLKNNHIYISLQKYDHQDLGIGWEVKAIVDNWSLFCDLYTQYPLSGLACLDDYYLYLLSIKFAAMREVIPVLSQNEDKDMIAVLSSNAEKAISTISSGDVIRFINGNIHLIFTRDERFYDMQSVTLDFIAKYNTGIRKDTFLFLCKEHGYLMIDQFDQFEKVFELYPDLFETIFPTGHFEEINAFRFEKVLEIWCHILSKRQSSLKEIVNARYSVLSEDIKSLSKTATIDNIFNVESPIREFLSFLQRIQSPLANEFSSYAKGASNLLSKRLMERGQSFEYEIPVNEIIEKWKNEDRWELRLLSLTHQFEYQNESLSCYSRLSVEPKPKHPLLDVVRTNIPTDDYFTMSHQQDLSIKASVGTGTLTGIIWTRDTLIEYLSLVISAITLISRRLYAEGEQLSQDVEMLSALVQLVMNNTKADEKALQGMCYGASMFTCAFAEKILRIFYLTLAKGDKYIPTNKATLGELLLPSNSYITDVFGINHVKNLSFFLQKVQPSNIGNNTRNHLAHWSDISTESMTPFFLAKMLWLFTDILNTVFLYCLTSEHEETCTDTQP